MRERLEWCLRNRFNDFSNWVFVDETSCWINAILFYHWRHPSTYPDVIDTPVQRLKLNLWGALSSKGASEFVVNLLEFYFKCKRLNTDFLRYSKTI